MSVTTSSAPLSDTSALPQSSNFKIKNIVTAAFLIFVTAGGVAKRDEIGDSLVGASRNIKHLSIMGVEVDFNEATIDKTVRPDIFQHLDAKAKTSVAQKVRGLNNAEVVRLLNVGLLEKLCDFELGTAQMREDFQSDMQLRDKGLAHIQQDDGERAAIIRDIKKKTAESHGPSDIGYPRICYRITLTDAGRDAHTALVYAYANGTARGGS